MHVGDTACRRSGVDMEGSRERIVRIIQQAGAANVEKLSRQLGLAPATVRRHLDILQRDGLVTYSEVRKKTGRPEYSFSLTERGHEVMPRSYDALLAELLQEIGSRRAGDMNGKSGPQVLKETFESLGRRAGAEYMARAGNDPVAAAVAALRDRDFAPEVAQTSMGLRVRLTNCPFRSVARLDKSVCTFDQTLITRLLGTPVQRESCIADGASCCEYVTADFAKSAAGPGRG